MSYNDQRAYIGPQTLAAQNAVASSSGAIVAGGTTALLPSAEATFICSIGMVVSATPTTPPAGVKPFVVVGTTTTTGPTAVAQSSGSSAVSSFIPSVAVAAGSSFTVGFVCTGTAAATETIGAATLIIGVGPQYV